MCMQVCFNRATGPYLPYIHIYIFITITTTQYLPYVYWSICVISTTGPYLPYIYICQYVSSVLLVCTCHSSTDQYVSSVPLVHACHTAIGQFESSVLMGCTCHISLGQYVSSVLITHRTQWYISIRHWYYYEVISVVTAIAPIAVARMKYNLDDISTAFIMYLDGSLSHNDDQISDITTYEWTMVK